jgi:DNA invertase Pin-like site-specific DNA recombinase
MPRWMGHRGNQGGYVELPLIPYIRQSRAREQTISLEVQREAIVAWATANKVPLAAEVVEQGVSGSKSWRERELGAAIEAVREGRAAGVIVAYQDRLSREQLLGTAEVWEALESAKARFVAAAEGLDTARGSKDDRMLFAIKAAIARREWERYQENWEKAMAQGLAKGAYVGPTPVGYDRVDGLKRGEAQAVMPGAKNGRLVKNEHAPAIERAFRIKANGGSWTEVARSLSQAGVPTATGQTKWAISSVASMLRNPIYKGELRNGHVHQFPEYVIIEPSVWHKVNRDGGRPSDVAPKQARWRYHYDVKTGIAREEIKRERRHRPAVGGRKDAGEWAVLGGLLFCGGCGHRMTPHYSLNHSKKAYRYYVCQNVGQCEERARIAPGEIEPLVVEAAYDHFAEFISQAGIGHAADTEKLGRLEIERDQAQLRLSKFLKLVSLDDDEAAIAERLAELRADVQRAEAAIIEERASTRRFPTVEEVRAIIDTGTVREKRQVLRHALRGVAVWRRGVEPHDVPGKQLRGEKLSERVEAGWKLFVPMSEEVTS